MDGTEVGSLYYDLNINDKNLRSQLNNADKAVQTFGDRVSKYWGDATAASKKFALAMTVVGAGVTAFGVLSVKAFEESQNAIAQTNAVLKSTGQVAGITADQVTKLATALEAQTKFSDEDVRSVENLLLTFTAIGKDIFPQATKTVLNMATALGEDTKSASIQLGKALQDPILGVTALRRVGVNFNSAQQEVIANLVNTGKSAEAQKMILAELNKEFGGSATAAAKTFSGQLAILKNQFNNVQEAVGGAIVQAITPLVSWLAKVTSKIQEQGGLLKVLKNIYEDNKGVIYAVIGAIIGGLIPAFVALGVSIWTSFAPLIPFLAAGAAIALLVKQLVDYMGGWTQTWNALKTAIQGVWAVVGPVLIPAFSSLWNMIQTQLWPAIKNLWNAIQPLLPLLKFLGMALGVELVALVWIQVNVMKVLIGVYSIAINAIATVYGKITGLLVLIGGLASKIVNALSNPAGILYEAGRQLIQGLINGIVSMLGSLAGKVKDAVGGAVRAVKNFLGIHSPSKVFMEIGKNVTQGFVKGITDSSGQAMAAMGSLANNVIAPTLNLQQAGGGGSSAPSTTYGGTTVNIGTVNDRSDADYILRRIDRNQQLESMGAATI